MLNSTYTCDNCEKSDLKEEQITSISVRSDVIPTKTVHLCNADCVPQFLEDELSVSDLLMND